MPGLGDCSADHAFADVGKLKAGVGKAVEVVLALAAAIYDSPESQQSQVVAHSRLAHVELVAHPPDMALSFGEQADNLESGRVADLLEQNRCPVHRHFTMLFLVLSLGSLRGLLLGDDRCDHRNLSPKELDRREAGATSPFPPGNHWDQIFSEMEASGVAQIIYTRRFSTPVSQSIQHLNSLIFSYTIEII